MKLVASLIIGFFILIGCAATTVKISKKDVINPNTSMSYGAIKSELTRGENKYGYFAIEATLYTESLIKAELKKELKLGRIDKQEFNTKISEQKRAFVDQRTCLLVTLGTDSIHSAKFKHWTTKLNGKEVKFTNTKGISSVPSTTDFLGYSWSNISTLCGPKIDISKGLSIKFVANLISDAPPSTLVWKFK